MLTRRPHSTPWPPDDFVYSGLSSGIRSMKDWHRFHKDLMEWWYTLERQKEKWTWNNVYGWGAKVHLVLFHSDGWDKHVSVSGLCTYVRPYTVFTEAFCLTQILQTVSGCEEWNLGIHRNMFTGVVERMCVLVIKLAVKSHLRKHLSFSHELNDCQMSTAMFSQ